MALKHLGLALCLLLSVCAQNSKEEQQEDCTDKHSMCTGSQKALSSKGKHESEPLSLIQEKTLQKKGHLTEDADEMGSNMGRASAVQTDNYQKQGSSASSDKVRTASSGKWSSQQKHATLGAHVTGFGDCMPFCDRARLKSLIKDFVVVYKKSRSVFVQDLCGCQVQHCYAQYAVAHLAQVDTIVENGINVGMSGYLFRDAKPHAHIYHIDPRSRPMCDPALNRWNDTGAAGLVDYYTGPSKSLFYKAVMTASAGNRETEADWKYAQSFNSKGFEDFFAIDWSKVDREKTLVFFDTHQRDFENLVKGVGMGFKLFLFDDNYNGLEQGDMGGMSIKQTFARADGQAINLADAVDFYYEMPPLINPFTVPEDMLDKYKIRSLQSMQGSMNTIDRYDYMKSQTPLLDLADEGDRKLFEMLLEAAPIQEFRWYTHMAIAGKKL